MPHTTSQRIELTLADWTRGIQRSALQDMLVRASAPGVISFALGLPAAELFPAGEIARAAERVLASEARALQYGPPLLSLKSHIVSLMTERNVHCHEDQVFLTTGAQQAMNLLGRLLLNPGGEVVMEELGYPGFCQAIEPLQPKLLTVPSDLETGIDVEAVEYRLKNGDRPAFIYAVTDGHNPLGVSMSLEKRAALVEISRRFAVPIVEDDAYGFLSYGSLASPMRALDDEFVFYIGSFSKILAPGLRVGWILVPEEFVPKLSVIKEGTDIDSTTLSQRCISAYLDEGHLQNHLARLRTEYRLRRDVMASCLNKFLSGMGRWRTPDHGFFIWVKLMQQLDTAALLTSAIEVEKVAFIPGQAFDVTGGTRYANCLRLNFSNSKPELIEDGIGRLASMLALTRHLE